MGTIKMKHPSTDYVDIVREDPMKELERAVRETRDGRRDQKLKALKAKKLPKIA